MSKLALDGQESLMIGFQKVVTQPSKESGGWIDRDSQTSSPRLTKLKCTNEVCQLYGRKKDDKENVLITEEVFPHKKSTSKNSKIRHTDNDVSQLEPTRDEPESKPASKKSIKKIKKSDKDEDGTKGKSSASKEGSKNKDSMDAQANGHSSSLMSTKNKKAQETEGVANKRGKEKDLPKERTTSLQKSSNDKKKIKAKKEVVPPMSKKEKKEGGKKASNKKESITISQPSDQPIAVVSKRKSGNYNRSKEFIMSTDKLEECQYFNRPQSTEHDPLVEPANPWEPNPEMNRPQPPCTVACQVNQGEEQKLTSTTNDPIQSLGECQNKNNIGKSLLSDDRSGDNKSFSADPRTDYLDELTQIPVFSRPIEPMTTTGPVTACASTMTNRPRKSVKSKPSNVQQSQAGQVKAQGGASTKLLTMTKSKSGAKVSRKYSRLTEGKQSGMFSVKEEDENNDTLSMRSHGHVSQQQKSPTTTKYHKSNLTSQQQQQPMATALTHGTYGTKHFNRHNHSGTTSIFVKPNVQTNLDKSNNKATIHSSSPTNNNSISMAVYHGNGLTSRDFPGRSIGTVKLSKISPGQVHKNNNSKNNRPNTKPINENSSHGGTNHVGPLHSPFAGIGTATTSKVLSKSKVALPVMMNKKHMNVTVKKSLDASIKSGSTKSHKSKRTKFDNWKNQSSRTNRTMEESGTQINVRNELFDFGMLLDDHDTSSLAHV